MKTYTARSSAIRAARKELGQDAQIDIDFKIAEIAPKEWKWEKPKPVKAPQAKEENVLSKSSIESPCRAVWSIAEEMQGQSRKEVLAECVKRGIAFYTARTQYQQWRTAVKNSQG